MSVEGFAESRRRQNIGPAEAYESLHDPISGLAVSSYQQKLTSSCGWRPAEHPGSVLSSQNARGPLTPRDILIFSRAWAPGARLPLAGVGIGKCGQASPNLSPNASRERRRLSCRTPPVTQLTWQFSGLLHSLYWCLTTISNCNSPGCTCSLFQEGASLSGCCGATLTMELQHGKSSGRKARPFSKMPLSCIFLVAGCACWGLVLGSSTDEAPAVAPLVSHLKVRTSQLTESEEKQEISSKRKPAREEQVSVNE